MKSVKKLNTGKAGFGRIFAALLIFVLTSSLCGCKNSNADEGDSIDIVVDGGGNESPSGSDPGSNSNPDPDPGINVDDPDPGLTDPDDSGQDLSGFPSKDELVLAYPEYAGSIVWNAVPKDYIGGFGDWVVPNEGTEGYVNIREKPSISSAVVGELRGDDDIFWWCMMEIYKDGDQLYVGMYKVKADNFTWTPVEKRDDDTSTKGWVALEVVQLWGL